MIKKLFSILLISAIGASVHASSNQDSPKRSSYKQTFILKQEQFLAAKNRCKQMDIEIQSLKDSLHNTPLSLQQDISALLQNMPHSFSGGVFTMINICIEDLQKNYKNLGNLCLLDQYLDIYLSDLEIKEKALADIHLLINNK